MRWTVKRPWYSRRGGSSRLSSRQNNVHEAGGICDIGADLAVYFDEALHDNGLGFAGVESVLQSGRSQQRRALIEIGALQIHRSRVKTMNGMQFRSVRAWGWVRRIGTGQFVQKLGRRRAETLLMLIPTVTSTLIF